MILPNETRKTLRAHLHLLNQNLHAVFSDEAHTNEERRDAAARALPYLVSMLNATRFAVAEITPTTEAQFRAEHP
jgi:tRNA A37 threonylcarbamoyladenosine dehydratase